MPSEIKSIIFDLDGVLIDSLAVMETSYHYACNSVMRGEQYPPFSEYCKYLGRSLPEIIRILGLPPEIRDSYIMASYEQLDTITLYDGIRAMLSRLDAAEIPIAIATGKERARTLRILENLGVLSAFKMVMCSDQVQNPKPAPDMANRIIETLNWHPPETLFVGDAKADIQCGRAAGTQTALALWGKPDQTALDQTTTYRLQSPAHLLACAGLPTLATLT